MRILMLAPQLPYPPRQGTSLRNYHILLGLSRQHELSLLTFSEETESGPAQEKLAFCERIEAIKLPERSLRQRMAHLITTRQPDMAQRLESSIFDEQLQKMLKGNSRGGKSDQPYDIVQVEGLEMANRIPLIRQTSPNNSIIFDNHNAEAELQRRAMYTDLLSPSRWPMAAYSWIQTRRLERFEATACLAADWVTAVSDADRKKLEQLAAGISVRVVPNCIDVESYRRGRDDQVITNDLVFIGKMDYRPNVDAVLWFAEKIWPLIQQARPHTTWAIVGQKPHKRLERVGKLKNVSLTGWVDRVQPYLYGAGIVVMPFRIGSGTRLKLIEAMASGKTLVSTTIGAEGYPVNHEKELIIADEPSDFSAAILSLLNDPLKRATIGENARRFAQRYDWRQIISLFDDIYAEVEQ